MPLSGNRDTAGRPRRKEPTHRFHVGQIVRLKPRFGDSPSTAEFYHITLTLPARDNFLQYRIRNDDERYERVATEDRLEPVDAQMTGDGGATLVERTFRHGQGTEAKHSRTAKTKTGEGTGKA